jgi:hypothetical protein
MNTLVARPALSELYDFIDKVDIYPISVTQVIDLARRVRAPKPVTDFYKSFGRGQVFSDQEDLLSRSEQVEIMRQEERDMPKDDLSVPQED